MKEDHTLTDLRLPESCRSTSLQHSPGTSLGSQFRFSCLSPETTCACVKRPSFLIVPYSPKLAQVPSHRGGASSCRHCSCHPRVLCRWGMDHELQCKFSFVHSLQGELASCVAQLRYHVFPLSPTATKVCFMYSFFLCGVLVWAPGTDGLCPGVSLITDSHLVGLYL